MTNPGEPTLRVESVEQILCDERSIHETEHDRLQAIIDRLAGESAVLAAERDRLRSELQQVQSAARKWTLLQSNRDALADDMANQITVHLEEYQDDGSGRKAVCLEHDEITVDLTEDEYVPATVIVAKPLSDTDTARFLCRLQAEALRYSIEHQ
jgi:hypothetical protein